MTQRNGKNNNRRMARNWAMLTKRTRDTIVEKEMREKQEE